MRVTESMSWRETECLLSSPSIPDLRLLLNLKKKIFKLFRRRVCIQRRGRGREAVLRRVHALLGA